MALTRTPRSSWIDEGLRALAAGGADAVRVESLARALGVTKGGFYWHFDDRRALLEEMLDTWERVSVDEVIERVEVRAGWGVAQIRRQPIAERWHPGAKAGVRAVPTEQLPHRPPDREERADGAGGRLRRVGRGDQPHQPKEVVRAARRR